MNNAMIINRELPEVAKIVEVETRHERRRRGSEVSPHDLTVQVRVAQRILDGLGRDLRERCARQAERMAVRDRKHIREPAS